jgi:hypothetical protein
VGAGQIAKTTRRYRFSHFAGVELGAHGGPAAQQTSSSGTRQIYVKITPADSDELDRPRCANCCSAIGNLELGVDVAQMPFHRVSADAQSL